MWLVPISLDSTVVESKSFQRKYTYILTGTFNSHRLHTSYGTEYSVGSVDGDFLVQYSPLRKQL